MKVKEQVAGVTSLFHHLDPDTELVLLNSAATISQVELSCGPLPDFE